MPHMRHHVPLLLKVQTDIPCPDIRKSATRWDHGLLAAALQNARARDRDARRGAAAASTAHFLDQLTVDFENR